MNKLDTIKEGIDIVKDIIQCDFKEVTVEQRNTLRSNFNSGMSFLYCEDGGYNFIMSKDSFKNFEYYIGMEYEREHIETKLEIDGVILVCYNYGSSRANELLELLEE